MRSVTWLLSLVDVFWVVKFHVLIPDSQSRMFGSCWPHVNRGQTIIMKKIFLNIHTTAFEYVEFRPKTWCSLPYHHCRLFSYRTYCKRVGFPHSKRELWTQREENSSGSDFHEGGWTTIVKVAPIIMSSDWLLARILGMFCPRPHATWELNLIRIL